jgi:hypothetical protein
MNFHDHLLVARWLLQNSEQYNRELERAEARKARRRQVVGRWLMALLKR